MLSTLNSHYLDDKTAFDEASHTYTHVETARKFPKSVTYLVKDAFPSDFNANEVIESNLSNWASNAEHKYFCLIRYLQNVKGMDFKEVQSEIKKLWAAEGDEARNEGTKMHAALEDWLNRVEYDEKYKYACDMVQHALQTTFYKNMELKPYRTEFRVFLTTTVTHPKAPGVNFVVPVLSGTIDALFKDKFGRIWIIDWKRIDPAKKGKIGYHEVISRFTKNGVDRFASFPNTPYYQYSLQLILYEIMLTVGGYLDPGQEVAGCFLCQIHPTMATPHFIQAACTLNDDDLLRFEEAAHKLIDDHIEACKKKELARIDKMMEAETEGEEEEYNNPTVAMEQEDDD